MYDEDEDDQRCTCPDLGPDNWKTPHDETCPVITEPRP